MDKKEYLSILSEIDVDKINKQLKYNYHNQFKLYFNKWWDTDKSTIALWIMGSFKKDQNIEELLGLEINEYDYHDNEDNFPNRVIITIKDYVLEYLKWETVIGNYTTDSYKLTTLYKIPDSLKNKMAVLGEKLTVEMICKAIDNKILTNI